ncbi:chemotaxis protein CheB [soil metagenome]
MPRRRFTGESGDVEPALVVVGASAGGLSVLQLLVAGLPANWPMALAIVQHRSRESHALCELLQDVSALPIIEVNDKEEIVVGHVFLAPPDYHMLAEDEHVSLSVDDPERWSRPSIDVLFESAADALGDRVVGVVLTGANSDGSRGLRRIVDSGGQAVVQDPATAEVRVMPEAARRAVPEACVLPMEAIPGHLANLRGRNRVPCVGGVR